MGFLPHAHRISLLSPAPVSHIFHSCRPSMPRKQKAASVPTPIKQSHKAMVVSYRPQTLHDTIHTVLPGEVLPAIPGYSEFIAVRLFVFQLTASRRGWQSECSRRECAKDISTHSLTKRLTSFRRYIAWFVLFQLTASRRGWLPGRNHLYLHFEISTHSLTKRLTENRPEWSGWWEISTHSLTKRLTWNSKSIFQIIFYFNSQPHEEADCNLINRHHICSRYFNSQPHEEADFRYFLLLRQFWYFNSQPHEEADGTVSRV